MKIICWVNNYDKKEFSCYRHLDILFSNNFDKFNEFLTKNGNKIVPIISMTKIAVGKDKIKKLLQKHSHLNFYLLDKKFRYYTVNELLFLTLNENVINRKYYLDELLKELSII
jgi:hypothetical protein